MADTQGQFQFMHKQTSSSLFRNGKVLMQRDERGDTNQAQGVDLVPQQMSVLDARLLGEPNKMTWLRNGFELVDAPVATIDYLNHKSVVEDYYPDCEALVKNLTQAKVYAFDHNIRAASGVQDKVQIKGGQNVQGPAHVVHGDYTLRSAPERLAQLTKPPSVNDTLRDVIGPGSSLISPDALKSVQQDGARFAILNVWRNIDLHPVATHPMALCDGQTVTPEDLVVFELHYADRIGENYFSKYSPAHQMYYFPEMTQQEALIIKQWDSAGHLAKTKGQQGDAQGEGAPCTFSFHSAFYAPDTPADAPDRWSIEVRCMVVYN